MQEEQKKKILADSRDHIGYIREKISEDIQKRETKGTVMKKTAIGMSPGDALAQYKLAAHNQEQTENLKQLYPSPYFTRCEFEINGDKKIMYFAKFSFSDEKIYSWITPAATLRFEEIGPAAYTRPDGNAQSGVLLSKNQYMIVDGKLIFLSSEGTDYPRELIYQEHFTRQKSGFILPEVVEQMEKAQDQIVRASYRGPFIISGPAGSGKTTMALHRVAYLMQSPETAELFPRESVLVLVQDTGTKDYFSHLLPELGIKGVEIITFAQWALSLLSLDGYKTVVQFGADEKEKINYEYSKLTALIKLPEIKYNKNIWILLKSIYENIFTKKQMEILAEQKKTFTLDRFDLTILLEIYFKTFGKFSVSKEYYEASAGGSYRKKTKQFPVQYNLVVVDEFQNYLPEQLSLLKKSMNDRLESVVYVGDLAQQTQLGTIRRLDSIGEKVEEGRLVMLQKVYRNTKQILRYIGELGYSVDIPDSLKDGQVVLEYILKTKNEEIDIIKKILAEVKQGSIGILSKDKEYLTEFKKEFSENYNVHCLSMQESQGVEFDVVCIVGINERLLVVEGLPEEILQEVKKVQRDILYVALTRAMSELHLMGEVKLSEQFSLK